MNYSKRPIIYNNKKYNSINECINDTGISRYKIKKKCIFQNDNDNIKFINFGRKSNNHNILKEKINSIYLQKRSIRSTARYFHVSDKIISDLIDQYNIKRITLSKAIILKSDLKRPIKEELENYYSTHSLNETYKHYNIGYNKLLRWLNYYNIKIRKLGETNSIKHNLRHNIIKPKYNNLIIDYKKYTIHELATKYNCSKDIIRNWLHEYNIEINKQISRKENELFKYCKSLDDSFIQNDRSLIKPYELDIVLHKNKLAIEYCGIYWHSSIFKKRNYHKNKVNICEKLGYTLLTIFESDNIEKVKSLIKSKLGLNPNRIYARNCNIKEISSKEAYTFYKKYHLMNTVKSKYNLGLFYNNVLVMSISFSKTRYTSKNNNEFECTRLCSHKDYSIIGGVSKLFKHSIDIFGFNNIVTYADRRFGNGNSYLNSGFKYSHTTSPNFYYFDNNNILYSRIKFQKHKLKNILSIFDPNKTADENIFLNGYKKIYDCGNNVYRYKKEDQN